MSRPSDSRAIEQALFDLLPDFTWCGHCGTASRSLTSKDAQIVIDQMVIWSEQDDPLVVLDAFVWIFEMHGRASAWSCSCPPPRPPKPPPTPNGGFHLYRLWGQDDRLLYVGVSTRLRSRLASHKRRLGDLIVRISWEEHENERAMLDAETAAIRNEDPALNKAKIR